MDANKKKKTANFIIALGYCLVAAIILLNYVSGRKNNRIKKIVSKKTNAIFSQSDFEYVRKQLKEEKRLNKEMRGALKTYQNAIKDTFAEKSYSCASAKVSISETIPVLKALSRPKQLKSPFKKGKNPFIALNKRHFKTPNSIIKGTNKLLVYPSLKSIPKIPFIISGSNDKINFASNY